MEMRGSGGGGGGCCIARYGMHSTNNPNYYYGPNNNNNNNNNAAPYDQLSKMERIMLRFRPIAPKPHSNVAVSPITSGSGSQNEGTGKGRKRSVTTSNGSKRRKSGSPDYHQNDNQKSDGDEKCHVVTLPLLPESPDLSPRDQSPTWHKEDQTTAVVVSTVMVEGVTDTWVDGIGLGRTDEERKKRLDEDTCPGFISDGWDNRVVWTNKAYRQMVMKGDTWRKMEVEVRLGMREKVELPAMMVVGELYGAFTCRVRVEYGSHWMTVPCDVWRLDGGGFAWRLDVKAALSLSI